jgi:hypothetical protein
VVTPAFGLLGQSREDAQPPAVRVQSVLYRTKRRELDALVKSVCAAARFALDCHAVRSVTVAFGDSSPHRTLSSESEQDIASELSRSGVDEFHYEFYDCNRGSAGGQNALFEHRDKDTEFVFVLNPDAYLCPNVLGELLTPFDEPEIGIVEARQLPLEHPKAYDPVDGTTSWASGACMMVRVAVLERISGFDSDSFFLYCDDVDFSWRARLAGYRIIHQPSARVFHDKRLISDGTLLVSEAERYYAAESSLLMAWKYSRPDLVTKWSAELLASDHPEHHRALESFRERERQGHLPPQLDPLGSVAAFVGHYYGQYRYHVRV